MIPGATYRIQFHKLFPFVAAVPLAPHLRRLGISHVYTSPILKARAGSMHGYDVVDHSILNPELGGEAGFRRLAAALGENGLGLIVDIVPNHMAADAGNGWWMDVLARGRASRFASYFDVDWDVLDGKILLAILGRPYWQALEAREVALERKDGKPLLRYFDHVLPLRPQDENVDPAAFSTSEALHELLERQHYRLAWWRTLADTINWRRFFDVPDLIALRQETGGVFEATHAKIFELYREGLIDGVRVDHVDGLKDPASYSGRLRSSLDSLASFRSPPDADPYVVVEKILGAGESLPSDWSVDGTTGYDFMNQVSAVQHAPGAAELLANFWHRFSGRPAAFEDEERAARVETATGSFESALARTAETFGALAALSRSGPDITAPAMRRGLLRILQQLRVYRTYATGGPDSPPPGQQFDAAVEAAMQGARGADRLAIGFVADAMHDGVSSDASEAVRRFNQLSAPVAAKAVEDTAFYRYGRLLSRNDVGFNPATLATAPADFHAAMAQRGTSFSHAMLATATHDHKRGEDVRARLAVLSEIPDDWTSTIEQWFAINAPHRSDAIFPGDEYQLYQTLLGVWPLELMPHDAAGLAALSERIAAWQEKALREAKLRTSWLDPDAQFESANKGFARALLDPQRSHAFLESLFGLVERIGPAGALNGLVQAALRCTVPGVPDCYQGTEFWDLSLVDPDNRRPVDYAARISALATGNSPADLLQSWRDGRVKQALIAKLLNLRKQMPQLFSDGDYLPLQASGRGQDHVLAFARRAGSDHVIVAVPLRCAAACRKEPMPDPQFWQDTSLILREHLQSRSWKSLFGNPVLAEDNLRCADLFGRFPVAVLI
ncbi:MAG: malto-oligosyltrehalose synthase [Rhizomicrobium sp.]